MDYMKTIGSNVKAMRLKFGWYQEDLAEKVGCSQAHISNIENGKYLSIELLFKMSDVLKCHPRDFLK